MRELAYARVVTTEDGGSAFEDDVVALTTSEVAPGVPPMLLGALPSTGPGGVPLQ